MIWPYNVEQKNLSLPWDTSIEGTQNQDPKKVLIIFLFVNSIEGTPNIKRKGHFQVLGLEIRFYLHLGDILDLKKWLTTKVVDKS